jgi:hypothetical protein
MALVVTKLRELFFECLVGGGLLAKNFFAEFLTARFELLFRLGIFRLHRAWWAPEDTDLRPIAGVYDITAGKGLSPAGLGCRHEFLFHDVDDDGLDLDLRQVGLAVFRRDLQSA